MDYAKNEKYFKKSTKGLLIVGILLTILGVCLMIYGITDYEDGPKTIGIVSLIIGIILAICSFFGKPISDEEYDNSIKSELSAVKNDALENLNIDESEVKEVEPIMFECFNYDTFDNIKEGKDGKIRTDRYKAVVIYPTQNELNAYEYDFSTTEELKIKTGTTYFYEDIVSISVSTKTRSISEMQNKKISLNKSSEDVSITYEDLKLITKGGSSLSISLIGKNDSIRALRALLKDKKKA
ncbi:MAG: hypothetical protein K5829_05880 [Treponema sp.]|nr:hypothetical protein [Treponema sp.]